MEGTLLQQKEVTASTSTGKNPEFRSQRRDYTNERNKYLKDRTVKQTGKEIPDMQNPP